MTRSSSMLSDVVSSLDEDDDGYGFIIVLNVRSCLCTLRSFITGHRWGVIWLGPPGVVVVVDPDAGMQRFSNSRWTRFSSWSCSRIGDVRMLACVRLAIAHAQSTVCLHHCDRQGMRSRPKLFNAIFIFFGRLNLCNVGLIFSLC